MGNQLRALEAALAVARVLRRMLVVPDYMADNGEGESHLFVANVKMLGEIGLKPDRNTNRPSPALLTGLPIRYDAIWEFGFLEELVGRNNVILQADFDALLQDGEVRASRTCHAISLLYRLRRVSDAQLYFVSCASYFSIICVIFWFFCF